MRKLSGYRLSDFNNDGVLKTAPLLWLIICYLSRHVLLLAISGFSTYMVSRFGSKSIDFSFLHSGPLFLLASLPATVIFVAALLRSPAAGKFIRCLWSYGRSCLMLAASTDAMLLLVSWQLRLLTLNEWIISAALLDIYILIYLSRSLRVRDTFAEFPEPIAKQQK